jgi:hypothetical protein
LNRTQADCSPDAVGMKKMTMNCHPAGNLMLKDSGMQMEKDFRQRGMMVYWFRDAVEYPACRQSAMG